MSHQLRSNSLLIYSFISISPTASLQTLEKLIEKFGGFYISAIFPLVLKLLINFMQEKSSEELIAST